MYVSSISKRLDSTPTGNKVYLGLYSLLIVYSNGTYANQIHEYDLTHLGYMYINNEIAIYHTYDNYTLISPTVGTISNNGIFYVLAVDKGLNDGKGGVVVLAYRTF